MQSSLELLVATLDGQSLQTLLMAGQGALGQQTHTPSVTPFKHRVLKVPELKIIFFNKCNNK